MTEPADFDALEMFRALGRHKVEYVTVGGVAIQAYGGQRMTSRQHRCSHRATNGTLTPRTDCSTCSRSLGDLSIPIAHRDDLLTMKRAAGRPQNLADVRLLESLDDEP